MGRLVSGGASGRWPLWAGLVIATIFASPARAADDAAASPDQQCLGCHGTEGMTKTLPDGGTLALHVPGELFAKSVHGGFGCSTCHADIDPASHPPTKKDIKSARAYSLAAVETCRTCHGDKFENWDKSIHATLVRDGNAGAPVCTDCHSPHEVIKAAASTMADVPCKTCHAAIFNAYAGSMHAQALRKSPEGGAPLCSGCHSAHEVLPVSFGEGPKGACLGCHQGALEAHKTWLPNAAQHFELVSCPVCHAPKATRKVDLRLYDSQSKARVEHRGVPVIEAPATADGRGLDALALWNLLQTLNREGTVGKAALRGRLEVRTGPEAHQLTAKSTAIRDCATCHRQGSEAFQSVTVSVVGPDGRRVKTGANPDVLSSMISINSVGGFYAIGGTRIGILDVLLLLAFLGALAVPIGHLTLGWLIRRYMPPPNPPIGPGAGSPGGDAAKAA